MGAFRQIVLRSKIDSFSELYLIAAHPVYIQQDSQKRNHKGRKLSDGTDSVPTSKITVSEYGLGISSRLPIGVSDDFKSSFITDHLDRLVPPLLKLRKQYNREKLMKAYNIKHTYLVIALNRLPNSEEINADYKRLIFSTLEILE